MESGDAQLAWVFTLPRQGPREPAHGMGQKRESSTYAVTLGTRGAAGTLGSRGASGTWEARSTSDTRSALREAEQVKPRSGGHRVGGRWAPGAAPKPAGYLHWHL